MLYLDCIYATEETHNHYKKASPATVVVINTSLFHINISSWCSSVLVNIQHLDNDKRWFCVVFFVCVGLKDTAVVLDEFDHYLVTDVLVLHCFETGNNAGKEEDKNNIFKNKTDDIWSHFTHDGSGRNTVCTQQRSSTVSVPVILVLKLRISHQLFDLNQLPYSAQCLMIVNSCERCALGCRLNCRPNYITTAHTHTTWGREQFVQYERVSSADSFLTWSYFRAGCPAWSHQFIAGGAHQSSAWRTVELSMEKFTSRIWKWLPSEAIGKQSTDA